MKSKIIIIGAILCAITTTNAHAVMKCVALGANTVCQVDDVSYYENKPGWELACTTNGVSMPVKGVAVCAATSGSVAANVEYSEVHNENNACWCKIVRPVVSKWICVGSMNDSTGNHNSMCIEECSLACAQFFSQMSGVWAAFLQDEYLD